MAEKLVILSDMWGSKKGLWITSYLGYLQQYFDIQFHDTQQLADVDIVHCTSEKLYEAFSQGGKDIAVAQLLKKEAKPAHYLTFCAGGTVAWLAAQQGLPIRSLYAISPIDLPMEEAKPDFPVRLLYGGKDENLPSHEWAVNKEVSLEIMPQFGHELYSDEKIIQKVCLSLLEAAIHKKFQI
jgi:pimeloyl-ACP methyl ester carboxylesterase